MHTFLHFFNSGLFNFTQMYSLHWVIFTNSQTHYHAINIFAACSCNGSNGILPTESVVRQQCSKWLQHNYVSQPAIIKKL